MKLITKFYWTWLGIRDARELLVPQSENPIYMAAFTREYLRDIQENSDAL